MRSNTRMVSASSIGMAAKCGHYLELQHKGTNPSESAIKARVKGDAAHERMNHTVEDKRCYVASYLYGENHQVTHCLRRYRDSVLLKSTLGRLFVSIYYRISPTLVFISTRLSILDYLLSSLVSKVILMILSRKISND